MVVHAFCTSRTPGARREMVASPEDSGEEAQRLRSRSSDEPFK